MSLYTYKDTSTQALLALDEALKMAAGATVAALEAQTKREMQRLIYQTPERPTYRRTGNLIGSVRHVLRGREGTLIVGASYARLVHEGTRFMSPRPFLSNAVKKVSRALPAIVSKAFKDKGFS